MDRNTLRTIAGFLGTLIRGLTGISLRGDNPSSVYNYLAISARLRTSGQPTAGQFSAIRDAGFERVVNLAPHNAENALPDEAAILAELGIEYVHIPVDFKKPTMDDFAQFADAMAVAADQPVWVHCAANMRVSAFVYKYRTTVLGESEEIARQDLEKIWEPFGVWAKFVHRIP